MLNTHEIVDCKTGLVVSTAGSLRKAKAAADKRNQGYGAHRYSARRDARAGAAVELLCTALRQIQRGKLGLAAFDLYCIGEL